VSDEAEVVKSLLSSITGAPFRISSPEADESFLKEKPIWFVWCPDAFYLDKMGHTQRAWRDSSGIVLESAILGDTIDWLELAYGEEAAAKSLDMDFSNFSSKEFRVEFASEFPLVHQRIQTYEAIATEVSKNRRIHIELRHNGSKGIVVFTFAARFEADSKSLTKKVEVNVEALREAYQQAAQI
jgi:hypothetical protein